jgi:hypothetical protein
VVVGHNNIQNVVGPMFERMLITKYFIDGGQKMELFSVATAQPGLMVWIG